MRTSSSPSRRSLLVGVAAAALGLTLTSHAEARSILDIGILRTDGAVFSKQDGIGAPWRYEVSEAKNFAIDSGTVSFVRTDGAYFAKPLGGNWQEYNNDESHGSLKAVAGGGYIGTVMTDGEFRARATAAVGQDLTLTMGSNTVDAALAAGSGGVRVGVIFNTAGAFYSKEGALSAPWVTQDGANVDKIVMSGDRMGMLLTNGQYFVKDGTQWATWVLVASDATSISLDGTRIGYINRTKDFLAKDVPSGGDLGGTGWNYMIGGAVQGALSGPDVGALLDNGEVWAKEGGLTTAPWQNVLQADGAAISFTHYEAADPPPVASVPIPVVEDPCDVSPLPAECSENGSVDDPSDPEDGVTLTPDTSDAGRALNGTRYNIESSAAVCKSAPCWATSRSGAGSWAIGNVRANYNGTGGTVGRVNSTFLDLSGGGTWRFGSVSWSGQCAWVKNTVQTSGRAGSTSLCPSGVQTYSFRNWQAKPFGGSRRSGGLYTRGNNCLRADGGFLTPGPSCNHGTAIYLHGPAVECANVGLTPTGNTSTSCAAADVVANYDTTAKWSGKCVSWRYVTRDQRWTMVRDPRNLSNGGWVFIPTTSLNPDRSTWPDYYQRSTC